MSDDHFNYDQLMLDAHRELIRQVLLKVEQTGLLGEHHFFIIFSTTHEGTRVSDRLRAQYPDEMTIVMQHQYSNLRILQDRFEIQLSFNRIPELLVIPFAAITGFVDPSVPFGLQLAGDTTTGLENSIGMLVPGLPQPARTGETPDEEAKMDGLPSIAKKETILEAVPEIREDDETSVPSIFATKTVLREVSPEEPEPTSKEALSEDEEDDDEAESANIVQLDAFRKKSK